jgi:hypothetical protein
MARKPQQLSLFDDPNPVPRDPALDRLPDVRDGLTREQRVILYTLYEAEKERPGKSVPSLMLYGRVCERMPISKARFQALLAALVGKGSPAQ